MKKLYILFILFASVTYGQVTTSPAIPTVSGSITITFNASGTELDGYTGDVYAHTGVLISTSTSTSDWKHVIGTWGDNTTQPKLTSTGTNTYELNITPDIPTFYGVTSGEVVTDIAIVFRSSDGSKQSRPDIFIPIYSQGLNVAFTNPANNAVFNLNDNITISAESSVNADLELKVNNTSVQTATNTTSISKSYTFTTTGSYTLQAIATQSSETKTQDISVYIKTPTQNQTLPSGLENGFNNNGDGTVTFVLQAPNKTDVFLLGSFNNWSLDETYQMKKDGDTFWLTVTGLDPDTEYTYQYYIDYSLKVADPYSHKILDPYNDPYISNTTYPNLIAYPTGETTGIVSTFKINETNYTWQNTTFTKPNKDNLVIYEMLIRDFTEAKSFQEAMSHLDYLAQLGINAIELMPISEFEGNESWGYNPSFHGALDKAYGTKNDFKSFVDACHTRGIAVVLDVVYNHAFGQSPLAQMYWDAVNNKPATDNPWLNPDAKHPYNVGYDFNHESSYTKTYVKQTLKYWVEEFKVDGFRFDLSKGFTQTNNPNNVSAWGNYDASRITILEDYGNYIWNNVSSDAYLILEHFADNSEETELANYGFMLWGNLNYNYNQNTMGYTSDSDISWISYTKRGWNNPNLVGYMESHDEQRLMYNNLQNGNSNSDYSVKDLNTALDRMRTAGAFFFTIPGPKMIWQFGELGYDIDIDFNGRTGNKPVHWDYLDNPNRMAIYNTWAKLINLKQQVPIFKTTDFSIETPNSSSLKTIHLNLPTASGNEIKYVTIIGNFGLTTQNISPLFQEIGTWYDLLNHNKSIDVSNVTSTLSLKPGEFKVYGNNPYIDPNDLDSDGVSNANDDCPNTPLGAAVDVNGCEVFSLPATNFSLQVMGETCRSSNNGSITIAAVQNLNYTAIIVGNGVNQTNTFTTNYTADNLEAGDYNVCITVDGQSNYEQCFNVSISQPEDISVLSKVSNTKSSVSLDMSGSTTYKVTLNGVTTETSQSNIELQLNKGSNTISVEGDKICQGLYKETIFYGEDIKLFPNPITNNILNIYLGNLNSELSTITVYSMLGNQIYTKKTTENNVKIDASSFSKGIYILNVSTNNDVRSFKIIKN